MLVHNQTRNPLSFDHVKRIYRFDPYGPCEVSEEAFEHMTLQRFPVSLVPRPPAEKAAAIVEDGRDAARGDEVEKLKNLLSRAESDAKASLAAATDAEKRREASEGELATAKTSLLEQTERANRFEKDLKAANDQLGDTARKLEESEQAMMRLLESATEPKAVASKDDGGGTTGTGAGDKGGAGKGGGKGQQQLPPQK